MHIADFSVRNSVLVNLLMGAIIIIGFVFALVLPLELFPSIKLEIVTVRTVFPGASAEDIEQLITIPVEEEIKNVSGIKVLRSTSSEGLSAVTAEIYTGEDIKKISQDIDSNISRIKDKLPEDSEEPIVDEVDANFPLINVAISGDVPRSVLRKKALSLQDQLLLVNGVDNIIASGLEEPVFWVNLDYSKMRQFGITINEVSAAIGNRNLDLPGGGFTQGKSELIVRTKGKVESVEDLVNIPVSSDPMGRQVFLGDISDIELGEEKPTTLSRVNGLSGISFWVNKQKNVDAIDTVKKIEELTREFEKSLPDSIEINLTNDESYWVKKRYQTMLKSGAAGLVLVLLFLGLFLNRKAAFIASLGIPVSFLGAFILMQLNGMTINLLSMFGLIMVLGIVVDDSIIVVENVQRYIAQGMKPKDAAIKGTKEVALPVLATVLTNIAAFIPLLFATGLVGEFLSVIPTVAIFALLFSLVEALLIMPAHCAEWLRPRSAFEKRLGWFHKIRSRYLKGLIFVLANRYVVVPCFLVIFFITIFIFIRIPNVMFYQHDTSELRIRVENPSQSNLEYTETSVKKIEEIIKENVPDHVLKNIVSLVGLDLTGQATSSGDHIATIIVQYEDFEKRKENAIELSNKARDETLKNVAGPKQVEYIIEAGLPTGKPVEVRIQGNDINTLKSISARVQEFLKRQKGVFGISDDLLWGKPEVRVEVDERKAAIFGLDTTRIAREVRTLVDGMTVAQTRIGKEEADINLKYKTGDVNFVSLLELHQIQTPEGGIVSLGAVANIINSPSILDIKRYDSQRAATVKAEVDQKITTSAEANEKVKQYLNSIIGEYPGYSYSLGGEAEEYAQTIGDILRAALVAIILIYLILASILRSYFQPFIIMSILPFTLIGVITGILIRGEPITLPAIIGTVALLGIVVNDSLVLMDFINKRVKTMQSKVMAVAFSAKHRFRPIILTTLTTFGGLSSLMFVYRGEASFLAPMAISLGFGLLFATVILLYLIPALYLILDDVLQHFKRKYGI